MPILRPWKIYEATSHNQELVTEVHHESHLKAGLGILIDSKIKSSQVPITCCLHKESFQVNWIASNSWGNGSQYGNIAFVFELRKILMGKKIYWVESVPAYKIPACRFLITAQDYSGHKILREYSPLSDKGPFIKIGGSFYVNKNISLQLMIEGDINLKLCKRIRFVKHHPSLCLISNSCDELGLSKERASVTVLSYILGTNIKAGLDLFTETITTATKVKIIAPVFENAIDIILGYAYRTKKSYTGIITDSNDIILIVKSSLFSLYQGEKNDFQKLVSMLNSYLTFEKYFLNLLKEKLNLTSTKSFRIEE